MKQRITLLWVFITKCSEGGALIAIPEVFEHHIDGNDRFIVLASDGVWDVVSNETAVEVVTASLNASGNDCKVTFCQLICLISRSKPPKN